MRYANRLPPQIEGLIVSLKRDKPHWGARKIRELLVRRLDGVGRPRHRACGTPLSTGAAPNTLWCADFKGEFKLGNGQYCYPLTVTDHATRFLLLCETPRTSRLPPVNWSCGSSSWAVMAPRRRGASR